MNHVRVLGDANGTLNARVLFVAEAPGRRGAARTGIPLTQDQAGRRFEAFIAIAGFKRDELFVTNAVLCNPLDALGNNRAPIPSEVTNCSAFLARTLDAVSAPAVVSLGRVALETLRAIEPHPLDLARDVGRAVPWRRRLLIPLYHPGRRSTLHRAHALQESDWRAVGRLLCHL
jgi:DNA polymerase